MMMLLVLLVYTVNTLTASLSNTLNILNLLISDLNYCITYDARYKELKVQINDKFFFTFYLDQNILNQENKFLKELLTRGYIDRIPTKLDNLV